MSTFFHNIDTRTTSHTAATPDKYSTIKALKARAVLVDMEEGPVAETLAGPLGDLFDQQQFITDVSGAGNNWAHGHCLYGPKYKDVLREKLHRATELCDSLQSFFVLHSLGGGTGSGLGTYILGLLEDEYPEVYRFTTAIFPSEDDDVVTSPYNSVLSLNQLTHHADCVLPIENEALTEICSSTTEKLERGGGSIFLSSPATSSIPQIGPVTDLGLLEKFYKKGIPLSDSADASKSKPLMEKERHRPAQPQHRGRSAFGDMNHIVARLLTDLTSSMRFEGSLNVDLNEITTNLVPFPKLHFLLSSISPIRTTRDPRQQPRRVSQVFSDVFSRDNQLIRSNPRSNTYLACGLLVRGNVEISDINTNIQRLQSEVRMIAWNQDGFKVGLCRVPPVGLSSSVLCLSNNTCIGETFQRMRDRFRKLYARRAHVHHYAEYMDSDQLTEAFENVTHLINEYNKLEATHTRSEEKISRTRLRPLE